MKTKSKVSKAFSERDLRKFLATLPLEEKAFVTFRHFRREEGAVTAACVVSRNEDGTFLMRVGFGFCSPDEPTFSRVQGRQEALKRLLSHPILFDGAEKIAEPIMKWLKEQTPTTLSCMIKDYNGKDHRANFSDWFPFFARSL